ncbi:MAG: hypothetical protein IJ858_05900 [Acidaminococcaceae bacterium]|nr:hypothetical protein [Acidaminococcaceae bacterium]
MFNWLIIYAEKFGKEFPLRLFSGKREYEVLQLVMDCCNSGQPYPEPVDPENVPKDPAEDLPAEAELEAQEAPAVQEPEPPKKRTRKAK